MDGDPENVPLNDMSTNNEKEPLTGDDGEERQNNTADSGAFDDDVTRVAHQAEKVHRAKGKRWDTYFYKVVLGGNTKTAEAILDCLHSRGSKKTLTWLMDTGDKRRSFHAPVKSKSILRLTQTIIFTIFAFISIILTPIFFAVHGFSVSIFNRKKRRLAANIKLPLAYAAFSQNDEMIKLFIDRGVDIQHTDNQGNNVFHYIADLSAESPERGIEIFKSVVNMIDDYNIVKQLLAKRRNSASLTAIEYASKFGSLALLTQMLNHPNILQHTAFAVGKEDIAFGDKKVINQDADEYATKLDLVDVSMYESGTLTKQSTILNLLSDREVTEMSVEDLALFDQWSFVGKWIALKTKQMFIGIISFHIIDIAITAFIIYMIVSEGGSKKTEMKWSNLNTRALLEEMKANGDNTSSILKPSSFHRIRETVRYDKQLNFFKRKNYPPVKLLNLYNRTVQAFPELFEEYEDDITSINITSNTTSPVVMDALYETASVMEEFDEDKDKLVMLKFLTVILEIYSSRLFDEHSHFLKTQIGSSNREEIKRELRELYKNFSLPLDKDGNRTLVPYDIMDQWDFNRLVCIEARYFTKDDLILSSGKFPPEHSYYDSCDFIAMYKIANVGCNGSNIDVYKKLDEMWNADTFTQHYYTTRHLIRTLKYLTILYLLLDIVERLVHIYTCVSCHTHVFDMMMSVLSKKVPGSYSRKQINVLTCFCLFVYCVLYDKPSEYASAWNMTYDDFIQSINYFLIIGMIARFIMHIHGLRLLPGIGNFVIATFMMSTNLIHFSTVYGIVLFIFSIIFHVIIEDEKCPLKKHDGFEDILDSMFQTFKLTFGHDEFSPYYINASAKLTYTIFIIISGLLLMNLIIAIMSTTATDIMNDPWKDILWRIEWLDEALSVEYTVSVITLPIYQKCKCGYWSHKKAGYLVQDGDDADKTGHKVYIEFFHCPALK